MSCADKTPLGHRPAVASRPHRVDTKPAMVDVAMAATRMQTRTRRTTISLLAIAVKTMARKWFISGSGMLEVAMVEEVHQMRRR